MNKAEFEDIAFPAQTVELFSKILTLGWYDGITDGLVCVAQSSETCRFDLLAWGPGQDQRVFALSPIAISVFDDAVRSLRGFDAPIWPRWDVRWPSNKDEGKRLGANLDLILSNAGRPDFVIETNSMFETVFAAKRLSGPSVDLIPDHFEAYPLLDNYDCWHQYLGLVP
jgi:hypothetical protein